VATAGRPPAVTGATSRFSGRAAVLAAVSRDGGALREASVELRADREVALAAALQVRHQALRHRPAIMIWGRLSYTGIAYDSLPAPCNIRLRGGAGPGAAERCRAGVGLGRAAGRPRPRPPGPMVRGCYGGDDTLCDCDRTTPVAWPHGFPQRGMPPGANRRTRRRRRVAHGRAVQWVGQWRPLVRMTHRRPARR
jgi:hypothetical protein